VSNEGVARKTNGRLCVGFSQGLRRHHPSASPFLWLLFLNAVQCPAARGSAQALAGVSGFSQRLSLRQPPTCVDVRCVPPPKELPRFLFLGPPRPLWTGAKAGVLERRAFTFNMHPRVRPVKPFLHFRFPAQAHGDPPRLRLFTEPMWKQFQRKLQSLGLSPKPKRSEGEGDKPKRPARTPSALSWELVWRRRG
jgi:hypothetical protein